eukprot:m.1084524 g.1084524  ORF g.1084524 m.1084524 type:complete len:87 (-) comp24273_c0_seq2:603-863(-)
MSFPATMVCARSSTAPKLIVIVKCVSLATSGQYTTTPPSVTATSPTTEDDPRCVDVALPTAQTHDAVFTLPAEFGIVNERAPRSRK